MAGAGRVIARALDGVLAETAEVGVRVTADQLYYATCRAVLPPLHSGPRRPGYLLPRVLPRSAFDRVLARSGSDVVAERLSSLAAASDAPDVLDYGLPRLLICQHDDIAAMLLANDLHMESGTAVLGGSQVVAGVPDLLREAMERGATTVYLLHDATLAGAAWRERVENGLPGRVVALGLRPEQARALHLMRGPSLGAELAAVPPVHLLRVLRRLLGAGRPHAGPGSLRDRAALGFLSWPGERR
ncbi:hypothetical protein [Pseudonocardia adelaidensis]|uniref:Uncharacterized protein n=1 Tax=Pseudonocardia adelaidensis TaxID=648754 RepID=A0ABP9P7W0_9PSEU